MAFILRNATRVLNVSRQVCVRALSLHSYNCKMSEHEHKVFVASLPDSLTKDDLYNIFVEYGTVESAYIITDLETRRSRGFGFVEFNNKEDAQAAIGGANGAEIQGMTINCNLA